MAKKASSSKGRTARPPKKARVEFQGYLNRNISADEKKMYAAAIEQGFAWYEHVEELCSDGYSIKWNWDEYNQCFAATLYNQNPESEHAGFCLSFRGPDPIEAMSRLCYVHFVLLARDWGAIGSGWDDDKW